MNICVFALCQSFTLLLGDFVSFLGFVYVKFNIQWTGIATVHAQMLIKCSCTVQQLNVNY